MKSYTHLTLSEREYLQEHFEKGVSIRKIAAALGRSPSTVGRELKRNWSKKAKHYHHWHAHTNYLNRRKSCHRKNRLLSDPQMFQFALQGLHQYWSPEIIAGRWNSTHAVGFSCSSVYRAVKAGLFPGIKPWTHLRRKGKPYAHQRKSFTKYFESSIHDRPSEAESRTRLGDFEGDTVYGSVGKGYLITAVDRRSRLLLAAIAPNKKKETTNAAFALALTQAPFSPLTLTLDNGTEFLAYKELEEQLGLKVYFADAHAPWQRGSNENLNGLIRFFFPRGTNFNKVSALQLKSVVDLINNRPRKCLGFLSPLEFIQNCCT